MLLKNVTPTNYVIARAGFTLCGALALWVFLKIFLPNIDENPSHDRTQKSYHLSAGPLKMSRIVNLALVIALRS